MSSKQLTVLGAQIRSAHSAMLKSGRDFLDKAYVLGERLGAAKDKVPRGEWQEFLTAEAPEVSERTVQVSMRIFSRWEEIPDDCHTVSAALKAISLFKSDTTSGGNPAGSAANPPSGPGEDSVAGDSQAVCSPPRAEGENDEAPSVPVQDVPTDGQTGTEASTEAWEVTNLQVVQTAWGQATKAEQTEIASWVEDQMAQRRGRRRGEFVPPSLAEVREYCQERNNGIDAAAFMDHYITCGWVTGKTRKPVKDWKGCVRTWERNRTANGKGDPDTVRV